MDRASQVLAQGVPSVPPGVPKSYRALADGNVPRARGRPSIEAKAKANSTSNRTKKMLS